ncbi:MAG: hypothetical protein AB8B39_07320, partial [Prochlorococcus sp.]
MSPATDTSTDTSAPTQQAVEAQNSAASLETPPSASFANLTSSFYKTYREGLNALNASPTTAAPSTQATKLPATQANSEASTRPNPSPSPQPISGEAANKALINFQEQSWQTHSHLPSIESITYTEYGRRLGASTPDDINITSTSFSGNAFTTALQKDVDLSISNSITPLTLSTVKASTISSDTETSETTTDTTETTEVITTTDTTDTTGTTETTVTVTSTVGTVSTGSSGGGGGGGSKLVADTTAPTLSSSTPADNATAIAV